MKQGISEAADATNVPSLERVNAFSDGVFAIIITIMVLELKRPEEASIKAFVHMWPTWVSYIASYLFVAVVWVNHHYLLKKEISASWRLIWANFAHMFVVSLIPFITSWMADTRLGPFPVALYAFDFFFVNVTYIGLVYETRFDSVGCWLTFKTRRLMRLRSMATLVLFLSATVLAFWHPLVSFSMVVACLMLYFRPDIPKYTPLKPVVEPLRVDLL